MRVINSFPGIREHEQIRLVIDSHWIAHAKVILNSLLVGGGLIWILWAITLNFLIGTKFFVPLLLLISLSLLFLWLWLFIAWIDDEFDVFILTNERLIDITQNGLFSISTSEVSLDLIQDVFGVTSGLLGNVLHYGTLQIQTASGSARLQINHVDAPTECARAIIDEKERFLQSHGVRQSADDTTPFEPVVVEPAQDIDL